MSPVCDPRPLATHDLPPPRDPSVAIELVSLTHELGIRCGNSGLLYPSVQVLQEESDKTMFLKKGLPDISEGSLTLGKCFCSSFPNTSEFGF